MRVDLPSAGKIGFSHYEINEPTLGKLRKVSNYPANEVLCKNQFILDCSPDNEKERFKELTVCDRDYLFMVLVCAINLNKIACEYVCRCGENNTFSFEMTQDNFIILDAELQYTTEKTFSEPITYNLLRVGQEMEIVEYALTKPDDQYEQVYETGVVAQTLGFGISEEAIAKVLNLDLAIYYSALFYQFCYFHGVLPSVDVTCRACQRRTSVTAPFTKALLMIDIASIMKSFIAFSSLLDFQSFCDMTVLELQNLKVLAENRDGR